MSVFKKTSMGLPRKDFRQSLRKTAGVSPFMTIKEGLEMEKKLFPQKLGSHISENEVNRTLLNLKRQKFQVKGLENKTKIDRQIKLLEKLKKS